VTIPNWTPPVLNRGMGRHWSVAHRLKKAAAEFLGAYAAICRVPRVSFTYRPVRRVDLLCVGWAGGETMPDPDAFLKFFLDAAATARLIVDDADAWCRWRTPVLQRGSPLTVVALEDIALTPAVDPAADPVVRRFVAAAKRKGKRNA
jgi:hypothetical protein